MKEDKKVLILFGSKTGTTKKCAEKIQSEIAQMPMEVVDIDNAKKLDLSPYQTIAIGTPIYIGRILRKVKKFLIKNESTLMTKDLHFFVCGMAKGEEGIALFEKEISPDLFRHATQVKQMGFELRYNKKNPLLSFVMKKIIEEKHPVEGLLDLEINQFAQGLLK